MNKPLSVAQVNRYIKNLLENDALLCELKVEGEISNFKRHSSGHLYFTLKDSAAAINCVMFASYGQGLKFEPENGAKVVVLGHASVYEKTGQYQLYAVFIQPLDKTGDLAAAFIKLRDTLKAEGLFDDERKKILPEAAGCVALVTSPTGAAVQDMIKIIHGRNPGVKIVVVPTIVQGGNAAADIVRSIQAVNIWGKADVMIVGRGGGSIEDLWAFNEEVVARAISESAVPVISAVGHETDFTISDFAADLRAPTPSAAAAVAVADISEQFRRAKVLRERLDRALAIALAEGRKRLVMADQLLEKLSPYALWERGYAMVFAEDSEEVLSVKIRSVSELEMGQAITVYMQDGKALAKVQEVQTYGING